MAERDPKAPERLFEAEPNVADEPEGTRWLELYTGLTEMLQRQLDETRRFCEQSPERLQRYLENENLKILQEELAAFRRRLAHWQAKVAGD